MSDKTWWFLHHNTQGLTPEQISYNAEVVELTNDVYRLESEMDRKRKRLAELTGKHD